MDAFTNLPYRGELKNLDEDSNKDIIKSTNKKQILISYVRIEAALHALSLKEEFEKLGFSVYLVLCTDIYHAISLA